MKKNLKKERVHSGAPTMSDVAKLACVSTMTVSRVLNKEKSVKSKTIEKVNSAIKQLRYVPNVAARNLASAKSIRIAFWYRNETSYYLNEVVMGLLNSSNSEKVELVLDREFSNEDFEGLASRLLESRIDGIVIPPPMCNNEKIIQSIRDAEIEMVALGVTDSKLSSVYIDDFEAAYQLTNHLIRLGHKEIGFIKGPDAPLDSRLRFKGFNIAMENAGLKVNEEYIEYGDFDYKKGLIAAEKILLGKKRPSAVFACNDETAAACVSVAHKHGINIPQELSICGFDDAVIATSIWPNLTTVRQPLSNIAEEAFKLLVQQIEAKRSTGVSKITNKVVDFQIFFRESTTENKLL